ncbi:hypothetical protein D3C76_913280 [compost metagenome]
MLLSIGIQIVGPPLNHEPAFFNVLSLVDVCRPHTVTLLVAHLTLYRVLAPQSRFDERRTGHGSEPMPTHLGLGVVAHASKRLVHRVLAHGLPVVAVTREHKVEAPGEQAHLLERGQCLATERYQVGRAHLGAAMRVFHTFNLLALPGDLPHGATGVDLWPARKPQLAGSNKNQQGELGGQPCQRPTSVAVDSLQQLRQPIQRQRRSVDGLACSSCAL